LHTALVMPADERAVRAAELRRLVAVHTPRTWLDELLSHAR
jgi:trehalose-6-phosphate synthase